MPWTEESPLSAAMGFAGSYLSAQDQAKKDKVIAAQRQQQIDQTNAYQAAQMKQMADESARANRSAGIDPATGQPYKLPASTTGPLQPNHGNQQRSDTLHFNQLMTQSQAALAAGYPEVAKGLRDEASMYAKDDDARQKLMEADAKLSQALALAQQRNATTLESAGIRSQTQYGTQEMRDATQTQDTNTRAYAPPKARANASAGPAKLQQQLNTDLGKAEAQNQAAAADGSTPDQFPYPHYQDVSDTLSAAIPKIFKEPKLGDKYLQQVEVLEKQKRLNPIEAAYMNRMIRQAQQEGQQPQSRGSQDTPDPQYPGP